MSVKLEKVVYADWHSAYRAWVTGLDTEPPLEGAFFAGWLVREAEIERLQTDNELFRREHDRLKHLHDLDHSLADQREAECERLRAALQVYADDYEGCELARETLGLPPLGHSKVG